MSLDIPEGSFCTLLGPSGCGKTTTLRMVAGLLDPTEGDISINGRRVNDIPIHKRNLGIVFQNYALFPHRTVAQNVGFGLKYRPRGSRRSASPRHAGAGTGATAPPGRPLPFGTVRAANSNASRWPGAVVVEPDVLLLDEPLSALDANLREDMRVELKNIQKRLGVTSIFVTHDQSEALAMSDQIIVMAQGRVEQVGPPEEVYNTPASEFVARFLGAANILEARVTDRQGDELALDVPGFARVRDPARPCPQAGRCLCRQTGDPRRKAETHGLRTAATTPPS